jgi:hypothetical protein
VDESRRTFVSGAARAGLRVSVPQARKVTRTTLSFTTIADSARKGRFSRRIRLKVAPLAVECMVRSDRRPPLDHARRYLILRHPMNDEPKSAAELKEIRVNRKLAQDAEGIKAMADIAAADIAIRKRTENLRAIRLAKEAADRANPPEPKAKAKPKKKKST